MPTTTPAPSESSRSGGGFQKPNNLPNTFQGDRGGTAEDEELLALLKGVSAGSSSSNRFRTQEDENASPPPPLPPPPPANAAPAVPRNVPVPAAASAAAPSMPSPFPTGDAAPAEIIVVTREELPTAIQNKDWKIRKESYIVLKKMIVDAAGGKEPMGEIDGESIMPGLDDLIPTLLMDKNAASLEGALEVALSYSDYCQGGESAERAEQIAVSLIKGNGLTSPRPAAGKLASALTIKLMEVGNNNNDNNTQSSLNVVMGVLLDQGLTSRKPKLVLMASTLILEAAHSFGAACLPLAAVKQSLPKLFSHSNKQVRDAGMEVIAELCRTLGSKAPMSDVIDNNMRPAQVKELDALLEKQSDPTPVTVGLRSRRKAGGGGAAAVDPEDALAALQAGAAELEAERFAKRPPANLLDAMRKTEYASKLKLAKWSEKVAGLKMILESGGEKPFKLEQPSHSTNYAPLISEMKGILSHTHFAVVGKAMEVLTMLAQGVGEKLYPYLRPLLPTLFGLSKDKKLNKGVASCLDSFFGNVLAFEHLLDPDSAIPEAVDEGKEKNALARSSTLSFLGRCVTRADSAGPRGRLTASNAKGCAVLCADKLNDSDASVRKEALNTLKLLQAVEDADIGACVMEIIKGLKTANPRAYKSLAAGTKTSAPSKAAAAASPAKSKGLASAPPKATAPARPVSTRDSAPVRKTQAPAVQPTRAKPSNPFPVVTADSGDAPSLDEAIDRCASLNMPLWEAADEDGGILAGLECKYNLDTP